MKPEDPAERRQTHFRGVRSGHETNALVNIMSLGQLIKLTH